MVQFVNIHVWQLMSLCIFVLLLFCLPCVCHSSVYDALKSHNYAFPYSYKEKKNTGAEIFFDVL